MSTVCVAIPVKDGAGLLAPSIESVLAQSLDGMTVLVIDNCSSDGSYEVAHSYTGDPRLRVVRNDRDVGYYGSLNRALYETDSAYLVPFANDDLMEEGNLARKLTLLERHGAGFAHSSARRIDGDGATIDVCPDHSAIPELLGPGGFLARQIPFNGVNLQSAVISVAALRAIGGWDMRTTYASDWLAFSRLSMRLPVVTLADPLLVRREHSATGTSTADEVGIEARDVPSTLDAILRDPLAPDEFVARRSELVAAACARSAALLDSLGRHRLADGWAAPMMAARALVLSGGDESAASLLAGICRRANLCPPAQRFSLVAAVPADDAEAAELVEAAVALGGRCEGVVVSAAPEAAGRAERLLGPHVPDDLDAQIVVGADDDDLLMPGVLVVARWGSAEALRADRRGLPVHLLSLPNAFGATGPFTEVANPFAGPVVRHDLIPDPYADLDPYGQAPALGRAA